LSSALCWFEVLLDLDWSSTRISGRRPAWVLHRDAWRTHRTIRRQRGKSIRGALARVKIR